MLVVRKFKKPFETMFPGGDFDKKFFLGKTKLSYVINHSLLLYFQEHLYKHLRDSNFITLLYVGSLNDVMQRSWMDACMCFNLSRHPNVQLDVSFWYLLVMLLQKA